MGDAASIQTSQTHFARYRDQYALITIAAIAAMFVLAQTPRPSDDAYITFRHVKNLAQHGVPSWNLDGPRVLGSTAPAYMTLLAAWSRITLNPDLPSAALWLNALLHGATVLLAFACARELSASRFAAYLTALVVAFNSVAVVVASQGFENPLLTVTLLSAFIATHRKRWALALVLASVAPLIRPEGIIATPIVWGALLLQRAWKPMHLVYFGAIPLAWLAFSIAYYGSPIPQSVSVKRFTPIVYWPYTGEPISLLDRALHLPVNLWDTIRAWGLRIVINGNRLEAVTNPLRIALGTVLCILIPAVWSFHAARRPSMLVYLLYPAGFVLFYAVVGKTSAWYFPSYTIFMTLLCIGGGGALLRAIPALAKNENAWRVSVAILALALLAVNRYTYHRGETDDPRRWIYARDANSGDWPGMERERYRSYRAAAERLNQEPNAAQSLALISEIGVFGYYFKGRVYDPVGLCSPTAPSYYPPTESDRIDASGEPYRAANNIVPARMIEEEKPDYVVNATIYMPHLLEPGGLLSRDYTRIEADVGTAWNEPVLIFARRPEVDR